MRILWVKMGGLWPANTGGRVRSLRTIAELSRRHPVTVVTTHGPGDDPQGLADELRDCHRVVSLTFTAAKRGDRTFPLTVARSWLSRDPVDLWKWRVAPVRDHVAALIADGLVDVCVCDFLFAAANVPMRGAVPVALFEHNVEYQIWQRLAALETVWWRRALFELEWRKLRMQERRACLRSDLTIAVSEPDADRLRAVAPGANVAAIRTGVDTDYFTPVAAPVVDHHPPRLVFTGSMDWQPNEDAIEYFAGAMLPLIRQSIPNVSVAVVGRRPTARLHDLADRSGIVVTGTVDDVRPYIAEAAVYVVPLRAGGGTRLKIFEALAMGKAVVSTTVGAEGLSLTPEREIVVADDPREFAHQVVSLLRDPQRCLALGSAGRQLVERHYSWAQAARDVETHLQHLVTQHVPSRIAPERCAHLSREGSPRR